MTEENYTYCTSQALLRNQFPGSGKLKIPIIPKFEAKPGDFDDPILIGFDKTYLEDNNHLDRMVHFFLYDYRFERVWKNPDNDIEKLSRYRAVLSPDFSMYLEIVYVDYDRSSWRYMNYERSYLKDDLDCYKIGGTIRQEYDIMAPYRIGKGGGSAYGGAWKPSKPDDYRLIGKPGEIKITYAKDGSKIETKIGEDGRAVAERHHTSSPNPKYHSNPHDHKINWESPRYGIPNFEKPHINYWFDEYPDGAPEFKVYGENYMKYMHNSEEDNRFKTISEFKECIIRGGEPVFIWNGNAYGVCFADTGYCIARIDGTYEKMCSTPDSVLEYLLDGDRLRDIITKVTVISRNI